MSSSGVVPGGGVGAGVDSFNGRSGTVSLTKADVTGTGLAAGDVGASAPGHSHAEADVTSLTTDLAGKAAASHTHAESDTTGLVADLAGKAAASHTHAESQVTNLTADLAGKAAASHTHAESDTTGLVADLAGKAAASHTHAEADVTNLTTDLAGHGARAFVSAAQSLPNSAVTVVNLDGESWDTDALHDVVTNNSRIVLNRVGLWMVTAVLSFTNNGTGFRTAVLNLNGTQNAYAVIPAATGQETNVAVSAIVRATAITDYVQVAGVQNSGGSLALNTGAGFSFLSAAFLGAA